MGKATPGPWRRWPPAGSPGGRAAIDRALEGMQVRGHRRMLIRAHLDHVTFLDRQVTAVEDEIGRRPGRDPAAWGASADGETGPGAGHGPDPAALPAADRLAEIPGISPALARRSSPRPAWT